jgi:hypothetical protein
VIKPLAGYGPFQKLDDEERARLRNAQVFLD